MAAYNTVIIIPSQGKDVGAFKTVALALARKVYGGKARVIRTQVSVAGAAATVAFSSLDGSAFSWDSAHHLRSVLTVSHGFSGDGPNLAYGLEDERYQAWGSDPADPSVLGAEARNFWGHDVKKAIADTGKIILVGCFMGKADYARNVAKCVGVATYASTGLFGAANEQTVLKYVGSIEGGRVLKPMVKAGP